MKSLFRILLLLLLISANAEGQTFSILKPSSDYPNFENLLFAFDADFHQINPNTSSLELQINGIKTKIDSILIQNSVISDTIELLVGIELTSALNDNDKIIIKQFIDEISNQKNGIYLFVNIVLFNNNQLLLADKYKRELFQIDDFLDSKFYSKPDLNKFSKSQFFIDFLKSKLSKSFILFTKSTPILDLSTFSQTITNNNVNLLNINLSTQKIDKYSELGTLTKSFYLNASEFSSIEKLTGTSLFLALGGKPHKIYWNSLLDLGKNEITLLSENLHDTTSFNIFRNDIPELIFEKSAVYYGIVEKGFSYVRSVRVTSLYKPIRITNIEIENPNFQLVDFLPNLDINSGSYSDIKIMYQSESTEFTQTKVTFFTNTLKSFSAYLYAGEKPSISETKINFYDTLINRNILDNETFQIKWEGSFPNDLFKIDYKNSKDSIWSNVTNNATNNEFLWNVPDITSDFVDIKVSQTSSDLVSEKVIQLKEHKQKITDITWSPNDSLIATASEDGRILLWEVKSGKLLKTLFQAQSKIISGIDWSFDGKYLAISANDTLIKIWNIIDDIMFSELKSTEIVGKIKFLNKENKIAGILANGNIIIWDFATGKVDRIINTGSSQIICFESNSSNQFLVTGSKEGQVILWNYLNGDKIKTIYNSVSPILSLNFSPSGNNIAVSTYDNRVRIFDINTGDNVLTLFDTGSPIVSVNWLANKAFISSSLNRDIRLWSPIDGTLVHNYDQHNSPVYMIRSSHNGNLISSIELNNIVHIWSPFDFPFERPDLISNTRKNIKVLHKRIIAPKLNLPTIQKGDTLYYYNDDFAINGSDFDIVLDTCISKSNNNRLQLIHPPTKFNFITETDYSSEIEYTPSDTLLQEMSVNIISGKKQVAKRIAAFVPSRFFDKKTYTINFGNVELGKFKDTSFFAMQNISNNSFTIDSVKILTGNKESFLLQKPSIPYSLLPLGGAFVPNISFVPQKIGHTYGIFRIFFKNSTPVDIQLLGYSTAPELQIDSSVNIGDLLCETRIEKTFLLKNIGISNLKITNCFASIDPNNTIESIFLENNDINPNDSSYLKVIFYPKTLGENNLQISLKTNIQNNFVTENHINIKFHKDSLNLIPDSTQIYFYPKTDLEQIYKVVKLTNTGTHTSDLKLIHISKYFSLDSISRVGLDSYLHLRFLGGAGISEYLDTLTFLDECGKSYSIHLLAYPGKPIARIILPQEIDFGNVKCDFEFPINTVIENTGDDTLKITKFYLAKSSPEFILPKNQNIKISPHTIQNFQIIFKTNKPATIHDTLIFESNAANTLNGISMIPIKANRIELNYSFNPTQTIVSDLTVNTEYSFEVNFNNHNDIKIPLNLSNSNNNFVYDFSGKTELLPQDSLKIFGRFIGKDEPSVNIDELTYTDECGNKKSFKIEISVKYKSKDFFQVSNVFPNPSKNKFYVYIISSESFGYDYRLIDNAGKLIFQSTNFSDKGNWERIEVNLEDKAIGVYLLEINSTKGHFVRKLIKLD